MKTILKTSLLAAATSTLLAGTALASPYERL